MRVVLQRVLSASVSIEGNVYSQIGKGLLLLTGFEATDTSEDLQWFCDKIVQLRIFSDEAGKMNLSVQEIGGELLVVSQFTLFASTRKGNRPSFTQAASPLLAESLYQQFIEALQKALNKPVATGVFGADMQVELVNDGPVTLLLDSKNKA
ncbi:MAG: D-aminoacyl-tRNA deacylase [Bacteroidia bacterium]|jgi:D-tyrosyl-tRNA(Tyr) deacylase